jgi:hypothetical protein
MPSSKPSSTACSAANATRTGRSGRTELVRLMWELIAVLISLVSVCLMLTRDLLWVPREWWSGIAQRLVGWWHSRRA